VTRRDGCVQNQGGKACVSIRKHDHCTRTREIKRPVRVPARNHPEGWKLQGGGGVLSTAHNNSSRPPNASGVGQGRRLLSYYLPQSQLPHKPVNFFYHKE